MERLNDISRGCDKWITGSTPNAETLGIAPVLTGAELTHEGLYVNQHSEWRDALLKGLEAKIRNAEGAKQ
jgi:anthranilate 1,2-dioxygenase (deaminating, decarboxylating) large subunit